MVNKTRRKKTPYMKDFRNVIIATLVIIVIQLFLWRCHLEPITKQEGCEEIKEHDVAKEGTTRDESPSREVAADTQMLSCLRHVLWNELPILETQGEMINLKNDMGRYHTAVFAHHGDMGNWRKWNHAVSTRTLPIPQLLNANCSVWELGANINAGSSREYMKTYGGCQYHAFEPIPDFVEKLREKWSDEDRMHVHAYGLADKDGSFMVPKESLAGLSTFIGDAKGGSIEAKIKSIDYALSHAGGIPTLLDINCEGCEFDFLLQAKKHGFLEKVPVIQIGWHSYGSVGIGARAWQTCDIRSKLSETHTMVRGLAFGWERWVLKDN